MAGLIDMAFTFSVQPALARRVTAILVLTEMYFVELQGSHRHRAGRGKPFGLPQNPQNLARTTTRLT